MSTPEVAEEELAAGGEESRNPTKIERWRSGWRGWDEEERGLTVLPFIGHGEAVRGRSWARTSWRRQLQHAAETGAKEGEKGRNGRDVTRGL